MEELFFNQVNQGRTWKKKVKINEQIHENTEIKTHMTLIVASFHSRRERNVLKTRYWGYY